MAVIALLTLTHFPLLLMKTDDTPANYLDSLILLRGLAAVMVCFCHFGAALSMVILPAGGGIFRTTFAQCQVHAGQH